MRMPKYCFLEIIFTQPTVFHSDTGWKIDKLEARGCDRSVNENPILGSSPAFWGLAPHGMCSPNARRKRWQGAYPHPRISQLSWPDSGTPGARAGSSNRPIGPFTRRCKRGTAGRNARELSDQDPPLARLGTKTGPCATLVGFVHFAWAAWRAFKYRSTFTLSTSVEPVSTNAGNGENESQE